MELKLKKKYLIIKIRLRALKYNNYLGIHNFFKWIYKYINKKYELPCLNQIALSLIISYLVSIKKYQNKETLTYTVRWNSFWKIKVRFKKNPISLLKDYYLIKYLFIFIITISY